MIKTIKYIFIFFILCLNFSNIASALENKHYKNTNYDLIYESLREVKFEYWNNEDPLESIDVRGYSTSPYPLLRLSEPLKIKSLRIDPGYYLLTPRNEERIDFVMFKQKGKIKAFVPVFEKQKINPKKIYKELEIQKPKTSITHKIIMLPINIIKIPFKIIAWPFKKLIPIKTKPLPTMKTALRTNYVQGEKYYLMELYIENYVYKMFFATEVNN